MKKGRNISELMKFNSKYQVVLVISTSTMGKQDIFLRKELQRCDNIRIIDEYLPNIEEIYQLSDVYFFPVLNQGNCIDVPLSCIEAASCNKPILTTRYGEMSAFEGCKGFTFIESFDKDYLNESVDSLLKEKNIMNREHILDYDWRNAISYFLGTE